jgi:hypothetical protein
MLQAVSQGLNWGRTLLKIHGKSLQEKQIMALGSSARFAADIRQTVSGRHRGELITDLPMWMLEPHVMQNHLYPTIDLISGQGPAEYLVIFEKNNPRASVPPDFEMIKEFDGYGILAVRKNTKGKTP